MSDRNGGTSRGNDGRVGGQGRGRLPGGSNGPRGGGRGGAHSFNPSYGIMPWVLVDGEWYFLVQMGYSSELYNFKVDPLRGKKEPGETDWETAVRECHEESGRSCLSTVFATICINLCITTELAVAVLYSQTSRVCGLGRLRTYDS